MILLWIVVLLLFLTFLIDSSKEGLEEDYLNLAIKSIESAIKDQRMNKEQKIALEDALSYANHIKFMP